MNVVDKEICFFGLLERLASALGEKGEQDPGGRD